jgi:hypothetical protein
MATKKMLQAKKKAAMNRKEKNYGEFPLTKCRKKVLSELEIAMFDEFTDSLWINRNYLTHPKTNISDEEMHTIVHNVSWLMNDYIRDVFKRLFKIK